MKQNKIPDVVVRRLPLYLRAVEDYDRREHTIVSSRQLGEWTGLTPAQVRKDLAYFGEFGKQGIGYNVRFLRRQLMEILGLNQDVHVGLIGLGNLGRALIHHNIDARGSRSDAGDGGDRWLAESLRIVAAFDVNPKKVGTVYAEVPVYHVDYLAAGVDEFDLKIMVIAVSAESAQKVADDCVKAGVEAILNFAPVTLAVPENVKVHSADLTLELQSLAFYVN